MLLRYTTSLTLGVGVTFALLLIMHALVATGHGPGLGARSPQPVDFVRVERTPVPIPETKPPEPPDEPPVPPERVTIGPNEIGVTIVDVGPRVPEPPRAELDWAALTNGALLPIVIVAPTYPPAAIEREIEGYVVVTYTVTHSGSIRDVVVTESTHRLLERAAVEAAYKFKYRPRVIDGKPVEVPGVTQRLRFVLNH